jgi:hypothetical protein
MGYLGAATGDVVTGYYSAAEHGGWQTAIYIWAGWAFGGAAIMAVLWNTTTGKVGLLPALLPKLTAILAIGLAGAALGWAGQSMVFTVVAIAAAGCLVGTLVSRWAAVPALIVSAASLVYVFASYIQGTIAAGWESTVAIISAGLAMISTVMILVEQKGQLCESS